MKTASKHLLWAVALLLCLTLGLTGCGTSPETEEPAQTQATQAPTPTPAVTQPPATPQETSAPEQEEQAVSGQIISITMAEMEEKLQAGESFLVSFVTINCPYCQDFHTMLVDYVQDHPVTMYQVILDYEETSEEENRQKILSYFSEFNTVPGVFYVKDGENYSYLDTYNLGVGMEPFDAWVQENNLI